MQMDPQLPGLEPLVEAARERVRIEQIPGGWRIDPLDVAQGADPLEIIAVATPQGLAVDLASWIHHVNPTDPDDVALALDLIAAALVGRVRVRSARTKEGRAQARAVDWIGPDADVRAIERMTRTRWPWQTRPQLQELRNAVVLHGIALGPGGMLPRTPWSGILASAGSDAPLALPIDGELDLHNFPPREVGGLIEAYIAESLVRGVLDLRIVHGKGIGELRRTVHAILARHPAVVGYRLGGHGEGGWGATIVTLRPRDVGGG